MNPHYQYFLAANGDSLSIKEEGTGSTPTKPLVSPIVETTKPSKTKPTIDSTLETKPLVTETTESKPLLTGTATRYKTCYAGCPDTEAVSVAMSEYDKNVKCPTSHPFSYKPSCNGGSLLEEASTRPIGGGGGGGLFGGSFGQKPSDKVGAKKKKNWLPVLLILGGVGVIILKPFK